MANLVETSSFDAGVYQIETSDIVQGGPGGIDNRGPQALANRTRWLLNNKLARDGSQSMTGSLVVGDGTANLATTVNGLGAGVGGGSSFLSRAGGVTRIAVGNLSAVLGGAFDASGIVLAAGDLVLGAGSSEGARLKGDSRNLGVGTQSPGARLHAEANNPASGVLQILQNSAAAAQNGALVQVGQNGLGAWRYGLVPGVDAWAVYGFAGGAYTEYLKLDSVGRLGLGVTPAYRIHSKFSAATGDGLRLENSQNNGHVTLSQNGTTGLFPASWANATVMESVCAAGGNFILSAYATPFQIQTGNARAVRFTVNLTGEVGINRVASAGVQLDVAGQVRSNMTGANFRALNATGNGGGSLGANAGANGGVTLSGDAGHIGFSADSAARGRWNGTGLRIGAGDAAQALDVAGMGLFTLANSHPVRAFSGAAGAYVSIGIGRTSVELQLGVAASPNNFVTGSVAGDAIVAAAAGKKLFLAAGSGPALSVDDAENVLVLKGGVSANLADFNSRSLASSGYQRLPGGLILQWGPLSAAFGTTQAVTFPIAFPLNNFGVFVSITGTGFSIVENLFIVSAMTLSGASVMNNWVGDASGSSLATTGRYFAIGN